MQAAEPELLDARNILLALGSSSALDSQFTFIAAFRRKAPGFRPAVMQPFAEHCNTAVLNTATGGSRNDDPNRCALVICYFSVWQ
jgi:hypothetical protein